VQTLGGTGLASTSGHKLLGVIGLVGSDIKVGTYGTLTMTFVQSLPLTLAERKEIWDFVQKERDKVDALTEILRENADMYSQCFPAGTPITLASGETVSIEDIAIDDHVAAVHNFSQETVIDAPLSAGTVSRLYTNLTGDFVELNFIDPATGKQTTLTSTLGHVFLDENGKWRQIGNMIVDANNIVPFTGSKIAEATIASKLTAMNLSQNAGANDNYYPAQTPQAQT